MPPDIAGIAAGQIGCGMRAGLLDDDRLASVFILRGEHAAGERMPDRPLDRIAPGQEYGFRLLWRRCPARGQRLRKRVGRRPWWRAEPRLALIPDQIAVRGDQHRLTHAVVAEHRYPGEYPVPV